MTLRIWALGSFILTLALLVVVGFGIGWAESYGNELPGISQSVRFLEWYGPRFVYPTMAVAILWALWPAVWVFQREPPTGRLRRRMRE